MVQGAVIKHSMLLSRLGTQKAVLHGVKTMTIEEICSAANRGEPVPDNLLLHDAELFACLRETYNRYHSGLLSMEDAMTEKQRLLYQFHIHERQHADMMKAIRHYNAIIRAVNAYQADLRRAIRDGDKDQALDAATHISMVLDGVERVKDGAE